MEVENLNPNVYKKLDERYTVASDFDDNVADPFDKRELFGMICPFVDTQQTLRRLHITRTIVITIYISPSDLIRGINDPEHPLTLEELHVVEENLIDIDNEHNEVRVKFTPTIPHCSMATLIGLSIRVKLLRSLPPRFKVSVEITPGTHASEYAVNKQLADKERVAAALENKHLIEVINQCIAIR